MKHCVFAFVVAGLGCALSASAQRQHILMDANWKFHLATPVTLNNSVSVTDWKWEPALATDGPTLADPALSATDAPWTSVTPGTDVFHGRVGYAMFRTTLPENAVPGRVLHFASVDDNATVYLNGTEVAKNSGWNNPFDVPLDGAWHTTGKNVVAVLVENNDGPGGIAGDVEFGNAPHAAGVGPISPNADVRTWRTVHLPHDFVVEGKFTPTADTSHGSLPGGQGWYRKTFFLPASDKGKSLWLDFDGVYRNSKVYLNGKSIGLHECGYTPFHYSISAEANYGGKNTLVVSADARTSEGWWYEGGGIYRHVWLNVTNPVHVAPWGHYVYSTLPEPGPKGAPSAEVSVKTTTVNDSDAARTVQIVTRVEDAAGHVVGTRTTRASLASGHDGDLTQTIQVAHPHLWSLEDPYLYRVVTSINANGRTLDSVATNLGIRTIRFDANNGFFLNGKSVKLKGTCNHQDFAGVGVAMPDSLLYWRIKKLKEMGSNAYRMSHNPPTSELLDACDKLGMLVMDENRHLGDTENGKAPLDTPYADLSNLGSMIRRDRNHPSIIMWSMCNEETIQDTPQAARIFTAMMAEVHKWDRTRPITCAMNAGYGSPVGITSVEDLQGINYNPGAYDGFHKAHPTMPLFGSETASTVSTRGVYSWDKFTTGTSTFTGVPAEGFVSAYDVNATAWAETAENSWPQQADRPFVAGGFAWTGFDYKGEPTPFGWPDINSNFGIMDECGFPKDAYYYYQSWWLDKPIVHVFPHWNWPGKEGQKIPVWVYSNAATVDLIVNGTSMGVKTMPRNGHVEWSVPYAPGTVTAIGYDAHNKMIGTDHVSTTGAPEAIRLTTDGKPALTANGEDLAMVEVDVLDAQGNIVPTADNRIVFEVSGAGHVTGVGNGDPSDHDPDKADYRDAFNGKCMVIVGAGEVPGRIKLIATSPGLKAASMTFESTRNTTPTMP